MKKEKYWMFNVNEEVLIKFNDRGYQRLVDIHNEFVGRIPNYEKVDTQYYKDQADEDGYTKMILWSFMQDFGRVTGHGLPEHYAMNIKINNEDLKEPENEEES